MAVEASSSPQWEAINRVLSPSTEKDDSLPTGKEDRARYLLGHLLAIDSPDLSDELIKFLKQRYVLPLLIDFVTNVDDEKNWEEVDNNANEDENEKERGGNESEKSAVELTADEKQLGEHFVNLQRMSHRVGQLDGRMDRFVALERWRQTPGRGDGEKNEVWEGVEQEKAREILAGRAVDLLLREEVFGQSLLK